MERLKWALISGRRRVRVREGDRTREAEVRVKGPWGKELSQPLQGGRGKEMYSPPSTQKNTARSTR